MNGVLVTGGAGFLGRHVCSQLHEAGHTVTCLDTSVWTDAPTGIQVIQGSILDAGDLRQALDGKDTVVHLAANAQLWAKHPEIFDRLNHQGTVKVLEAAKNAGIRRVVAASSLVILRGWNDPDETVIAEPIDLPVPEALAGPYCRSKLAAALAVQAARQEQFETTNIFCGAPVGSGDINLTPPTQMIHDLLAGKIPAYLPCTLHLVDVADLARAFVRAVEAPHLADGYIAAGQPTPMFDLLAKLQTLCDVKMPRATVPYIVAEISAWISSAVAQLSGSPPQAPLAGVRLAKRPRRYDQSRAERDLNWSPSAIDCALKATVEDHSK